MIIMILIIKVVYKILNSSNTLKNDVFKVFKYKQTQNQIAWFNKSNNILLDAAFFGQIFFQDPATNIMEFMINFHHDILFIMFLIGILIFWFLIRINLICRYETKAKNIINSRYRIFTYWRPTKIWIYKGENLKSLVSTLKKNLISNQISDKKVIYKNHNILLEIIWTVLPTIILLFIVFPSFALLYLMQPLKDSSLTIKVIGSQWYWSYEYDQKWSDNIFLKESSETPTIDDYYNIDINDIKILLEEIYYSYLEYTLIYNKNLMNDIDFKLNNIAYKASVLNYQTFYAYALNWHYDFDLRYNMLLSPFEGFVDKIYEFYFFKKNINLESLKWKNNFLFLAWSDHIKNRHQQLEWLDWYQFTIEDMSYETEDFIFNESIFDTNFMNLHKAAHFLWIRSFYDENFVKNNLNPELNLTSNNNLDILDNIKNCSKCLDDIIYSTSQFDRDSLDSPEYNFKKVLEFLILNSDSEKLLTKLKEIKNINKNFFNFETKLEGHIKNNFDEHIKDNDELFEIIKNFYFLNKNFEDLSLNSIMDHYDNMFTYNKKIKVLESYMLDIEDLPYGSFRLLEVTQRLVLPRNTYIRFIVTSTDVLHSWSIPSLGIKIDACPGRLNEVGVLINRNSVYYGQCSEICGVLHGFMPIVIETVSLLDYYKYLISNSIDSKNL